MLTLKALLGALPLLAPVLALSTSEIASVFPGQQTGLTGAVVNLPIYTLTVVTNETHALFSMNATTQKPFQTGWMATSIGSLMINADFLVAWPNAPPISGPNPAPWTLSHRASAAGESQPLIQSKGDASLVSKNFFTYLPALSTDSAADYNSATYTVVSYIRLLTPPSNYPTTSPSKGIITRGKQSFLYSSCSTGPANIAENAVITQHDQPHATYMIDLSQPISLTATTSTTSGSNGTTTASTGAGIASSTLSTARTPRDMVIIAHATFMSLAFLILIPTAIVIARFFRNSGWFPAHAALQSVAFVFVIIGFALGVNASTMAHFFDNHTRLGLAIFLLVIFQVALGVTAHRTNAGTPSGKRFPTLTAQGKSPIRFFHIPLGLIIVTAAFIQIYLGFAEWRYQSSAATEVPRGVVVVWGLLVAFWTLTYAFGWLREFKRGSTTEHVNGEHSDMIQK